MLAALLMLSALPQAAQASTQEFTIPSVGVDHDSTNAAAIAMDYARKRAVYLAAYKLGLTNPAQLAARVPEDQYANIIRGATVVQSRREGDTTYAEIKVTIVDEALAKALGMKDVAENKEGTAVRTILVLPVWVTPKKTFIWERENVLRGALSNALLQQAHGAVILPGGDLQDLRLIDRDNARTVTPEELKPMFDRYGADEIIMVIATPGEEKTDHPTQVVLRRLSALHPREEALTVYPLTAEDTAAQRLQATADAVAGASMQIATSTTAQVRSKLAAAVKMPVKFLYSIPRDLGYMTQTVRGLPNVEQLDMPEIALDNVSGTIYFSGDKAALRKQIEAKAIIVKEEANQWVLSVR